MITNFLTTLKSRNNIAYYSGWFSLAGAFLCILLMFTTNDIVLGINPYIKPFKFFLTTTILLWTMGWYLHHLGKARQFKVYTWMLVFVLIGETIYIFIQASKGELSHFNISTAFYANMFRLMGVLITILTIWTAYIGLLFFIRRFPDLPKAYAWGIRLGIVLFVIFAFEGFMMSGQFAHTVGAPDGGPGLPLVNWSTEHGDLRIAHFLGMHALQIIPFLSYYLIKNVPGIFIFSIAYLLLTSAILYQAMLGIPLISL